MGKPKRSYYNIRLKTKKPLSFSKKYGGGKIKTGETMTVRRKLTPTQAYKIKTIKGDKRARILSVKKVW